MTLLRFADTTTLLRRMPVIAMVANVAAGSLALLGWELGIAFWKSPFPNSSYITPVGSLLFILCGVALWRFTGRAPALARIVSPMAAAAVAGYCGFVVFEYATSTEILDHTWFMADKLANDWTLQGPPGRMAFNTSIAFTAFAIAAMVPRAKVAGQHLREVFSGVVLLLSLMTIIGYAYHVVAFSGLGRNVQMALYGALLFQLLGAGAFFADCSTGSARVITAPDVGGLVARRLLVATVASLSVLGWFRVQLDRSRNLDLETGTAALVVGAVVVVSIFTLTTARLVSRIERERERANAALRDSEERTRLATRAAEMGIWVWDVDSGRVYWNEKTRELFGWTRGDDVTYSDFLGHLHPDERERVRQNAAASDRESGEYDNQYRIVRGDGDIRWVAVRGRRFKNADGAIQVFGVIWDITDVHRTQDALVRGEKLASVGRMAATIAHEINNPLEAVMNLVYLCSSHNGTPLEVRGYLGTAEQELRRVAHLVRQTLGFYRESAAAVDLDLGLLIEDVLQLYRRRIENKALVVERRVAPNVRVKAAAGEIRQVVSNLITNAIDALPERGRLQIRVARVPARVEAVARITVADSGSGISPEAVGRVFEAFFTTKSDVGTGLGLWVSRQIVTKHDGNIRLRSTPKRGTVFTITLPMQMAAAAHAQFHQ